MASIARGSHDGPQGSVSRRKRGAAASSQEVERIRDAIAVRLSDKGTSLRDIGRVLGESKDSSHRRLRALEPPIKSYLRTLKL